MVTFQLCHTFVPPVHCRNNREGLCSNEERRGGSGSGNVASAGGDVGREEEYHGHDGGTPAAAAAAAHHNAGTELADSFLHLEAFDLNNK